VVVLFPMTLTALPPIVIGTFTPIGNCNPPRMLESPLVTRPEPPPAKGAAGDTVEPLLVESPTPLIALSARVSAPTRFTGSWLPPPTLELPLVELPAAGPMASVGAVAEPIVESLLVEFPSTLTAFPAMVTGRLTVIRPWFPPRMLSLPEVVALEASPPWLPAVEGPPEVEAGELCVADPELLESPIPLTALPPIVIGSAMAGNTWLPPPTLLSPLVVGAAAGAAGAGAAGAGARTGAGAAGAVVASELLESPMPLIALPATATGA
jgi:hypothetical protein